MAVAPTLQATPPFLLTRRRVYILPTGYGLALSVVLIIMLAGSINYNNSLGHMLTFLLASLAVVSMLHTYRNIAGLRVSTGKCEPVFAGEPARFPVILDNAAGPERLNLMVSAQHPEVRIETTRSDQPAQGTRSLSLKTNDTRRGVLTLLKVTVSTRYPLGLFRAWSPVKVSTACLIYPQPQGTRRLPLDGVSRGGSRPTEGAHGREDFAGLREYRDGDSPRHIHWKAAARSEAFPVKLFSANQTDEIELDWHKLLARDPEARLSQLCRWILEGEKQMIAYRLVLPGVSLGPGLGEHHRRQCLEALARFDEQKIHT